MSKASQKLAEIARQEARNQATPEMPATKNTQSSPEQTEEFTPRPEPLPWPDAPKIEAYSGLAGDVATEIAPTTEADKVAILAQFLVAFGNRIGRSAYFQQEATSHHANEFLLIVGQSARARKGTSWDRIQQLFEIAEPEGGWIDQRLASGLSSGEGLVWAVRDAIYKTEDGQQKLIDDGISDKRLLAQESEFASVLKQADRSGNVLSPILRQLWERGTVSTLTKSNSAKATGAHVSVVGHITMDELRRCLTATEIANGFMNRFMMVAVKRSQLLTDGGNLTKAVAKILAERIRDAITYAEHVQRMERDTDAKRLWHEVYPTLTRDRPGLTGSLLARAEAHVLRLSMVYALLGKSFVIQEQHLIAALAFWDYVERSTEFLFGDSTGDKLADEFLKLIRSRPDEGVSRTDLMASTGRHAKKVEVEGSLQSLWRQNKAHPRKVKTSGRPSERWFPGIEPEDSRNAK
jgi:hypothetical protein